MSQTGSLERGLTAIAQGRFDDALAVLRPLAEAGDAEAQFLLGYLFFTDSPVEHEEAAAWAARAAEQGEPDAKYSVGMCWLHGTGGPADPALAVAWLTRAAEQDCGVFNDTAAEVLATLYAGGEHGVGRDAVLADRWRERAALLAAAPARCGCRTCRRVRAAGTSAGV